MDRRERNENWRENVLPESDNEIGFGLGAREHSELWFIGKVRENSREIVEFFQFQWNLFLFVHCWDWDLLKIINTLKVFFFIYSEHTDTGFLLMPMPLALLLYHESTPSSLFSFLRRRCHTPSCWLTCFFHFLDFFFLILIIDSKYSTLFINFFFKIIIKSKNRSIYLFENFGSNSYINKNDIQNQVIQ